MKSKRANKNRLSKQGLLFRVMLMGVFALLNFPNLKANTFYPGPDLPPRVIKGVVTDNANEPLIGANVLVKGTAKGTVTDADGAFSLEIDDSDEILVISYNF